jgi:hypothetical protein
VKQYIATLLIALAGAAVGVLCSTVWFDPDVRFFIAQFLASWGIYY